MQKVPSETYAIIETILATIILFSPNFLIIFDFFKEHIIIFFVYNFILIYLLVSNMTHIKFR